ncbi:hypothetical protein CRG98_049287, partial [Punica granatum]
MNSALGFGRESSCGKSVGQNGVLTVCNYSEWVANIVPVEKKDGRVRVCVDYRDLNKASPKDNFPLPHID